MFCLPVSRQPVWLLTPDGHDELFLAEAPDTGFALCVDVVRRLAPPVDETIDWGTLPAADVDVALLALRRQLRGDRVMAEVRCSTCHAKGDLTLSVDVYLASHAPEDVRGIVRKETAEGVSFMLGGTRFRVPTVADMLAVLSESENESQASRMLETSCIHTDDARARRQAWRAIERMAPPLGGDVEGVCPECHTAITALFVPSEFVIAELRQPALAVFEEVHVLASGYGWSEKTILDLPVARRHRYAELLLAGRYASEPSFGSSFASAREIA